MQKKKQIHFVGIKGVGMTPLAIIAKEAGFIVSGSDIKDEFITDEALKKAGITPLVGFDPSHVGNIDMLITTGAHGGFDNIETKTAKGRKIPVFTQGEALGLFMHGKIFGRQQFGISVAGCHGKTTTTAMLATILFKNNFDPSFAIGTSLIPSLPGPGHFGKGKYFVAEADEYATEPTYNKKIKFLWQFPSLCIFTNIEFDHPDVFASLDEVRTSFLEFANNMEGKGMLVACGDDPEIKKLLKEYRGASVVYGLSPESDMLAKNINIRDGQTFFWAEYKGANLGEFLINVVGEHNVLNALAAIASSLELGLSVEQIKKGLTAFSGSKRRFELKGRLLSGALIYDDYAHHPTEIKKTLESFKKNFPGKKIVCIFQPHTYSRTKTLFEEFSKAFTSADKVILTDIYPSLREKADPSVSSEKLAMSIKSIQKDVVYLSKLDDVVKYLKENEFNNDSIIITMGAGDVYQIVDALNLE